MVQQKIPVKSTTIGRYLIARLNELGVEHVFGVPGDYVLKLDKLIEKSNLKFINTTNEIGAGYAADAYARMRGLGAACITFGVGISIINCLAQCYVEGSPMVVISGSVGKNEFVDQQFLHHLINKSLKTHTDLTQLEMFKHVTIDQGVLDNAENAANTIDRVLDACLRYQKPVYFEIPRDMVDQEIKVPHEPFIFKGPSSDPESLNEALEETKQILLSAKQPIIWAGYEVIRYGLSGALLKFAEKHQIPIVSSLLGKTVVDENHPLFAGVYQGKMSCPEVIELIDKSDCAFIIGVILADLDTGVFTAKLNQEHRLIASFQELSIGHHHFHGVLFKDFVDAMPKLEVNKKFQKIHLSASERFLRFTPRFSDQKITTKKVFECIQSHIKPEHVIVTDIGDCLFGASDLVLSRDSFIACAYFASLGFGTPAIIGAQIALPQRRVIGIIGDGGFQMTAMELSDAVRYGLDPIVIILNNHGYGTERPLLEGSYNDIQNWNYSKIPEVLGGGVGVRVTTENELDKAMREALARKDAFTLIEVELDKLDFSPGLRRLGELLNKVISKQGEN